MKKLMKKMEDLMTASALAEEMEGSEAVRELAGRFGSPGMLERVFAAAGFAEAGEFEIAREIAGEGEARFDELSPVHPDDCQYGDNDVCFVQA